MKIARIIIGILLILVLSTPILGATGVFPEPTADLYTPNGWAFMQALLNTPHMIYLIALTSAVVIVLLLMKKTALAAIILAPLTVNIIGFHTFVDTGLFSAPASLGWVVLVGNIFFLWDNRKKYKTLW